MDERTQEIYEQLKERYASGDVPWDDPLPPPEVIDLVSALPAARALDLGCGYGRATIYLARLGWEVDGIDFIPEAIAEAARRARAANVYARLHIGQVTDLGFLAGPYDLAIDVGCCHNLGQDDLVRYQDHLQRLIRPAGTYLLFARIREDLQEDDSWRGGIYPQVVDQVFCRGFNMERAEYGSTEVPGQIAWRSAWFWFRRR